MRKTINYFILRAISAILLGVLLIWIPKSAILYIVIAIGIFFILPGAISLIAYFTSGKEKRQDMPFLFTAIGSLLFGILLVSIPGFFVTVLMFLLGLIILFGAIEQIVTLIRARKFANVSIGFYVIPFLILIAGVLVLLNPFKTAETLFILIGITCLVYGIMELVNWLKFKTPKSPKEDFESVKMIED
ncbi:MAG: DUF308 domain-containing protein [Dysgonamonadaceae bacterium]|jgi:uncharacterized membrane protein HdeD (DUF308 family)|nr:DUF308 domain-containing protein [Dysgonamonadaceae bacterium]